MKQSITTTIPFTQRLKAFAPAIVFWMLSFYLFTLQGTSLPKRNWFDTLQVDKWVHITIFLLLMYLFYKPFKKGIVSPNSNNIFGFIAIAGLGYGVAIEFIQQNFVANRSFDIWDIVADGAGCLLAWLIWGRVTK